MMLVYSKERRDELTPDQARQIYDGHAAVMREAGRKGVLLAAEPLAPTSAATTVRTSEGRVIVTDGPFAETREQLAGYYILDCASLDEAIEWAAKIPTGCKGGEGSIEIRPLPGLPARPEIEEQETAAGGKR